MKCSGFLLLVGLLGLGAGACHPQKSGPELRVLGVQSPAPKQPDIVVVQLTNPASRPLRLTRLNYTFASSAGITVSTGEMPLSREVPAGQAIVVEIPLELAPAEQEANPTGSALTLRGVLTTETDEIVKTFRVQAQVQSSQPASEP